MALNDFILLFILIGKSDGRLRILLGCPVEESEARKLPAVINVSDVQ